MSVQELLGLDDDGLLVQQIHTAWESWGRRDPRLQVAPDFTEYMRWREQAPPDRVDATLQALATLGAVDGGDDPIAAAALALLMLPSARRTAVSLSPMAENIDEFVASQLWIEVRTFPWRRHPRAAAHILRATRAGVLYHLGEPGQVARRERAWAEVMFSRDGTDTIIDEASATRTPDADDFAGADPEAELDHYLTWATTHGYITPAQLDLIRLALIGMRTNSPRYVHTKLAGFTADRVIDAVCSQTGMGRTRTKAEVADAINALARGAGEYAA